MYEYPEPLIPTATEEVGLPSGRLLRVPKAQPLFRQWEGEFLGDIYGNKPIVDVGGEPMFAELAILRLFQNDGWDGVWVDTYRKKYRTDWGEAGEVKLTGDELQLLKAINQEAGSSSGCFDVFCWKGERIMFAESKRRSKDRIRETQLQWLEAALRVGLEPSSFLIVEWSFSGSFVGDGGDAYAPTRMQRRNEPPKNVPVVQAEIIEDPGSESEGTAEPSPSHGSLELFFDAYDKGAHDRFVRWRDRHQRGYVISRRSPNDAMLHQASCGHLVFSSNENASLTRTMKVCSRDKRELEAWARQNLAGNLKRCRSCM